MSMPHEKIRNVDMQPDKICQYLFFKMHDMQFIYIFSLRTSRKHLPANVFMHKI